MGVTYEDLAGKLLPKSPFLAACLLDAKNAGLRQAAQDALAKALGVENKLEVLFAPAADDANVDKVNAAEEAFKQQIDKAAFPQETASCTSQDPIEAINAKDLTRVKEQANRLKLWLSIIIVSGFFLVTLLYCFGYSVDTTYKEQLGLLLGALIAAFTSVVQYFFGSSAGSAEKTIMLQAKESASTATATALPVVPASGPPATTPGKRP